MLSANLDHLEIIPFISAELKKLLQDAKEFLGEDREAGKYEIDGEKVFAWWWMLKLSHWKSDAVTA